MFINLLSFVFGLFVFSSTMLVFAPMPQEIDNIVSHTIDLAKVQIGVEETKEIKEDLPNYVERISFEAEYNEHTGEFEDPFYINKWDEDLDIKRGYVKLSPSSASIEQLEVDTYYYSSCINKKVADRVMYNPSGFYGPYNSKELAITIAETKIKNYRKLFKNCIVYSLNISTKSRAFIDVIKSDVDEEQ